MLPQVLDNAADPVKSALPKGKLFLKNGKFPIAVLSHLGENSLLISAGEYSEDKDSIFLFKNSLCRFLIKRRNVL